MATQGVRRAQTREALLEAAAALFAERGVDGASIDAIAEAADRTSGAIYDHFGSKEGLLFALLEGWTDDVAAVITAELATATTLDERLASLWRNVADPPTGDGRWIDLEHELWRYAARNDAAREHLARRYRIAYESLGEATWWSDRANRDAVGPAVIGLLLGLEMMHRVDASAVTEAMAVAALRGVVTSLASEAGNPEPVSTAAGVTRHAAASSRTRTSGVAAAARSKRKAGPTGRERKARTT